MANWIGGFVDLLNSSKEPEITDKSIIAPKGNPYIELSSDGAQQ